MKQIEIRGYKGKVIRSFDEWESFALPPSRKDLHWKLGRSAWALGRTWTANGEPAMPGELHRLFESHEATRQLVIRSGITEHQTRLPFSRGGPRCHDLALQGENAGLAVTVCVEAKADESFGGTVSNELLKARCSLERKIQKARQRGQAKMPVTMFPRRLDWLTRALLGLAAFEDSQLNVVSNTVAWLPYQLLSAVAGTLLEAEHQNSSKAVFVIHEFRTTETADSKLEANSAALNRFLRIFFSSNNASLSDDFELKNEHMIGPICVVYRGLTEPLKVPCHIPLFIGKIRTELRC